MADAGPASPPSPDRRIPLRVRASRSSAIRPRAGRRGTRLPVT